MQHDARVPGGERQDLQPRHGGHGAKTLPDRDPLREAAEGNPRRDGGRLTARHERLLTPAFLKPAGDLGRGGGHPRGGIGQGRVEGDVLGGRDDPRRTRPEQGHVERGAVRGGGSLGHDDRVGVIALGDGAERRRIARLRLGRLDRPHVLEIAGRHQKRNEVGGGVAGRPRLAPGVPVLPEDRAAGGPPDRQQDGRPLRRAAEGDARTRQNVEDRVAAEGHPQLCDVTGRRISLGLDLEGLDGAVDEGVCHLGQTGQIRRRRQAFEKLLQGVALASRQRHVAGLGRARGAGLGRDVRNREAEHLRPNGAELGREGEKEKGDETRNSEHLYGPGAKDIRRRCRVGTIAPLPGRRDLAGLFSAGGFGILSPRASGAHTSEGRTISTDQQSSGYSYKAAGVDIDAGDALVEAIKPAAAATRRPGVMGGLGGFGGLFDLKAAGYRDPLLVAATDGVGTKLKIAIAAGRHETIGIDLVAMNVNDLVVQGAEPLFFLDYFATSRLDVGAASEVVRGIAEGCRIAGCALIGGETAEMPGLYAAGDYDLAGFCVGAVERDRVLTGAGVAPGDVLLGLASSGVHSNGYSLVRRIVEGEGFGYGDPAPFAPERTLGEALLEPTRIYVKPMLAAIAAGGVKAMAHITGSGIVGNLPRVLPDGVAAELDAGAWALGPVFDWLRQIGHLDQAELLNTFNCGLGMIVVVAADRAEALTRLLREQGETVSTVGRVVASAGGQQVVVTGAAGTWGAAASWRV